MGERIAQRTRRSSFHAAEFSKRCPGGNCAAHEDTSTLQICTPRRSTLVQTLKPHPIPSRCSSFAGYTYSCVHGYAAVILFLLYYSIYKVTLSLKRLAAIRNPSKSIELHLPALLPGKVVISVIRSLSSCYKHHKVPFHMG